MASRAKLVTKKDFASDIGVTPGRVSQLVKAGLPVRKDQLIELVRGRRWYEQHLSRQRPRKPAKTPPDKRAAAHSTKRPPNKAAPKTASSERADKASNGHARTQALADDDGKAYALARADRERAQAGLKTLEWRRRQGDLLERAEVEKAAADVARQTRDAVLGVPDRVAAILAAESDAAALHTRLTEELERALTALSTAITS